MDHHHSGLGNQQGSAGHQPIPTQSPTQARIPAPFSNVSSGGNSNSSQFRGVSPLPSIGQLGQPTPGTARIDGAEMSPQLFEHRDPRWPRSSFDDRFRRFAQVEERPQPYFQSLYNEVATPQHPQHPQHPRPLSTSPHERAHSQPSSPHAPSQSSFAMPYRNGGPNQDHAQSSSSSPNTQSPFPFGMPCRSPPAEVNGYPSSSMPHLPPILGPGQHPPTPPTPPMNPTLRPGSSDSHAMNHQQPQVQYGGHQQPQAPYDQQQQQQQQQHQQQQQQQQQQHQQQQQPQVQYSGHHQQPQAPYGYPQTHVPYGHHPPPTPPLAHSSSHGPSPNSLLQPAPITPSAQSYALPTAATPSQYHQQPVYQSQPQPQPQPHATFPPSYDSNLPTEHLTSNGNGTGDPTDPRRVMFYNNGTGPSGPPGRDHPQRASGSGMGSGALRSHHHDSATALGPSLRPAHHIMGVNRHPHHMGPNHHYMGPAGPFVPCGLEAQIISQQYSHFYHPHLPRRGCTVQERPYRCATCSSAFSRNHDLKRHEKIHLEIKPHACVCERRFSRKDALKRHQLVKACDAEVGKKGSGDDMDKKHGDDDDDDDDEDDDSARGHYAGDHFYGGGGIGGKLAAM